MKLQVSIDIPVRYFNNIGLPGSCRIPNNLATPGKTRIVDLINRDIGFNLVFLRYRNLVSQEDEFQCRIFRKGYRLITMQMLRGKKTIQSFHGGQNVDAIKIYRWTKGDNPVRKHSIVIAFN